MLLDAVGGELAFALTTAAEVKAAEGGRLGQG